ncbi:MAG: 4Fe-4S binding protein [Clostridia bacterium]|nr:4Fe-4S binding protein [Clostridia bacterium]
MIDKNQCIGCGACINTCPVNALHFSPEGKAEVDTELCIKCGACQAICPVEAINIDN